VPAEVRRRGRLEDQHDALAPVCIRLRQHETLSRPCTNYTNSATTTTSVSPAISTSTNRTCPSTPTCQQLHTDNPNNMAAPSRDQSVALTGRKPATSKQKKAALGASQMPRKAFLQIANIRDMACLDLERFATMWLIKEIDVVL
jgi:hypothetical protein